MAAGSGKAIVYRTGMNTAFGHIAEMTQQMGRRSQSICKKKWSKSPKSLPLFALGFGCGFFIIAFHDIPTPLVKSLILALGMIVALVPEGLLPTVTLALAMAHSAWQA